MDSGGHGKAFNYLKIGPKGLEYQCSSIAGFGVCTIQITERKDIKTGGGIFALQDMPMQCPEQEILKSFVFEFEENMANWRYECCKIGAAPVVFEPVRVDHTTFKTFSGVYCPTRITDYGRIQYQQPNEYASFSQYHRSDGFVPRVEFDEMNGQWSESFWMSIMGLWACFDF